MTELQQQIADTLRHLEAISDAIDSGAELSMGDIRLFTSSADWLGRMCTRALVDRISGYPERTAEEDRASQVFLAAKRAG